MSTLSIIGHTYLRAKMPTRADKVRHRIGGLSNLKLLKFWITADDEPYS